MSTNPPVSDSFDGRTFDYDTYYKNTVDNSLTGQRRPGDLRARLERIRMKWNKARGVKQYGLDKSNK